MIAIFSDSHDNLANLKIATTFCEQQNITDLIFCGDLTTPETLAELAKNFSTIYLTAGNCEIYTDENVKEYKNIQYFGRDGGIFKYENKMIGFCHEPYRFKYLLAEKPDIIFYGHTHKPWEEIKTIGKQKIQLINPGNLANTGYKASFAIYNPANNHLELKILDELINQKDS